MLDKYNSWHSLFKRAEPYKYLILNRRHAEHYTDQGHVVGRLFTELTTANQPSETDQSVLGSDHHYFQLYRWFKVYPDEHYESKPVNREKPETNFVHVLSVYCF